VENPLNGLFFFGRLFIAASISLCVIDLLGSVLDAYKYLEIRPFPEVSSLLEYRFSK
jgi:hypothetical protein